MTIYSSDYNARTRQMEQDTAQRARETALIAASQVIAERGSTADLTHVTVMMAKRFEQYIKTGR